MLTKLVGCVAAFLVSVSEGVPLQLRIQDKEFGPSNGLSAVCDARSLVHRAQWAVMSTISVHLEGSPFGRPISVSDGVVGNSTGIPFMYSTLMDTAMQDLQKDNRCSLTFSLAAEGACALQNLDPEDPRCSRLVLSGKCIQAEDEYVPIAREALFSRHPQMSGWPADHGWKFFRMEIENTWFINFFGGAKHFTVEEWFAPCPPA